MTDKELNFIKSYVLRTGRLSKLQKAALKLYSDKYCVPFDKEVLNCEVLFNNANPVVMEIGFGMGHATIEIAEKNPDINYIGIEVHTPGIGKVLNEIENRKKNVTEIKPPQIIGDFKYLSISSFSKLKKCFIFLS